MLKRVIDFFTGGGNFDEVDQEFTDEQEEQDPELFARIVELGERLHDQELDSAEHIGARAATVIGFAGVVLTLTVALSRDAFGRGTDLGTVGDPANAIFFLVAVVLLGLAGLQGVRAARPRSQARVSPTVLDKYRRKRPKVIAVNDHFGRQQERTLNALKEANGARAKTLNSAFGLLAAGVGAAAVQAVIIGIDRMLEVV